MPKDGGRIDVLMLGPNGKSEDAESEPSSKDMACKALWKAIKADNYEGFKDALNDLLGSDSEAEADDD